MYFSEALCLHTSLIHPAIHPQLCLSHQDIKHRCRKVSVISLQWLHSEYIHKVTKKSNTHVEKSRSYIFSKSQHWNFSDPCSGLFFLFFFQNYQTLPSCVQRDSFHNEKKIKVINYLNRENLQWTDVTKWLLLYQRSKEPFSKSCQVVPC